MATRRRTFLWLNHFDLLPGDSSVTTTYNAVNSGVGGGLRALVIQSSTIGEIATGGGNKVVHMAIAVPPLYNITGVRVGYEKTGKGTFISQIRLAQVQNPPASATVLLDDGTNHMDPGPAFVDSTTVKINPADGPLLLSLRVNFGDTADKIAIRGLGLYLSPA